MKNVILAAPKNEVLANEISGLRHKLLPNMFNFVIHVCCEVEFSLPTALTGQAEEPLFEAGCDFWRGSLIYNTYGTLRLKPL